MCITSGVIMNIIFQCVLTVEGQSSVIMALTDIRLCKGDLSTPCRLVFTEASFLNSIERDILLSCDSTFSLLQVTV